LKWPARLIGLIAKIDDQDVLACQLAALNAHGGIAGDRLLAAIGDY